MKPSMQTLAEARGCELLQKLGSGTGVDKAFHHSETASTSLEARNLASAGDRSELLVLADGQTAGRGRLGRSFLSPPGEGLWFSRVLRPPDGQPVPPAMTLVAGTAVCMALRGFGAAEAAIKWPNDILIGGRKAAGILAEASHDAGGRPFLVLGIGINLTNRSFPPELAPIATSLAMATGLAIDRIDLLREILKQLERLSRQLAAGGFPAIRAEYLACSATVGREVLLLDPAAAGAPAGSAAGAPAGSAAGAPAGSAAGSPASAGFLAAVPQRAFCVDVDEEGALVLIGEDGHRFRRNAGEVSLRDPAAWPTAPQTVKMEA